MKPPKHVEMKGCPWVSWFTTSLMEIDEGENGTQFSDVLMFAAHQSPPGRQDSSLLPSNGLPDFTFGFLVPLVCLLLSGRREKCHFTYLSFAARSRRVTWCYADSRHYSHPSR